MRGVGAKKKTPAVIIISTSPPPFSSLNLEGTEGDVRGGEKRKKKATFLICRDAVLGEGGKNPSLPPPPFSPSSDPSPSPFEWPFFFPSSDADAALVIQTVGKRKGGREEAVPIDGSGERERERGRMELET